MAVDFDKLIEMYMWLVVLNRMSGISSSVQAELDSVAQRLEELVNELAEYVNYSSAVIESIGRYYYLIEYNLKTVFKLGEIEAVEDKLDIGGLSGIGVSEDKSIVGVSMGVSVLEYVAE